MDSEAIGILLAAGQFIVSTVADIGPGAVGIDGEVAVGAVYVGLGDDLCLAGIRIDDRQLAAGVEVCRGIAFGD